MFRCPFTNNFAIQCRNIDRTTNSFNGTRRETARKEIFRNRIRISSYAAHYGAFSSSYCILAGHRMVGSIKTESTMAICGSDAFLKP